jgi:hypothetical protein
MNANAQMWLRALRSNLFPQNKSFLSVDGGFCCLGVGCEIAILAGLPLHKKTQGKTEAGNSLPTFYDDNSAFPPPSVGDWLGLRTVQGEYFVTENGERHAKTLARLNDDGVSFQAIADLIESEPEGLFIAEGKRVCHACGAVNDADVSLCDCEVEFESVATGERSIAE